MTEHTPEANQYNTNNPESRKNKISEIVTEQERADAVGAEAGTGSIWLNSEEPTSNTAELMSSGYKRGRNIVADVDLQSQVLRIYEDPKKRKQLAEDLYLAGYANDTRVWSTATFFQSSFNNMIASYNSSDEGIKKSEAALSWVRKKADISERDLPPGFGGGEDGGGGSGYSGPVQSISSSVMDDRDVEVTLNEFATEMLGRNLTKKELNKYSNKFKKQDALPQVNVRTPNGPAQVTSQTQERVTRDTIAKDILRENPDYAKNVINTDVLEMFANRLGL